MEVVFAVFITRREKSIGDRLAVKAEEKLVKIPLTFLGNLQENGQMEGLKP